MTRCPLCALGVPEPHPKESWAALAELTNSSLEEPRWDDDPIVYGDDRPSSIIRLANGCWLHETEFAAMKALANAVRAFVIDGGEEDAAHRQDLIDCYWRWRHALLDLPDEDRAIRQLLKIERDLSGDA